MQSKFPLECLPKDSLIRTYTEHLDTNSESPIQYHFASVLCGISVLLGRKVSYSLGYHTLFPNIYMIVIGESGMTRKSSATRPILQAVRAINSKLVLSTNISHESLIPSFQSQSTRIMFFDEMKMLFDLASKNFGGGIITTITSLHECPSEIRSEFKKDFDSNGNLKSTSIAKFPFLTILGLTTQEWLSISTSEISGGFLGRFLPIISIGESQKTIPFPLADEAFFKTLSSKLLSISKLGGKFKFAEETKKLWEVKYTAMIDEVRSHKSDQFSSFGSRLGDTLIKICMLLSASMPEIKYDITPEIFESASCLTDYFKKSYISLLSELSTSQFSADQNRLIKLMRRNYGRMSRSDIIRNMRDKAEYTQSLMMDLYQKGQILWFNIETDTKPRLDYFLTESFTYDTSKKALFDQNGAEIALKQA